MGTSNPEKMIYIVSDANGLQHYMDNTLENVKSWLDFQFAGRVCCKDFEWECTDNLYHCTHTNVLNTDGVSREDIKVIQEYNHHYPRRFWKMEKGTDFEWTITEWYVKFP